MIILHLLWGLVLWVSISKYGLGVSTDAVHLLFGARNFAGGNGLTSYDGSFLLLWPPLYPVLLALVSRLTGSDSLVAATAIQWLAYLGLSISLAWIFQRIFLDHLGLAVAASALTQMGSVVVLGFGMVGSDYVHLCLVMSGLALLGKFLSTGSSRAYVGLGVLTMLAMLQRYVGVTLLATAMVAIMFRGTGPLTRRVRNSVVLLITGLPTLVWLAITTQLYSHRSPILFSENFAWFSESLLEWFTGPMSPGADPGMRIWLFWLSFAVIIGAVVLLRSRGRDAERSRALADVANRASSWPYLMPVMLYGFMYVVILFGAASLAYFNKLGGRLILPIYIPLILLPVLLADEVLRISAAVRSSALRAGARGACSAALVVVGILLLRTTIPIVGESFISGVASGDNAYNNARWREDPLFAYWKSSPPSGRFVLISNDPDGVAFHTGQPVFPAPRRQAGPYSPTQLGITDFVNEPYDVKFKAYLFWIGVAANDYYYSPTDLRQIAMVDLIFTGDIGEIYRLRQISPDR